MAPTVLPASPVPPDSFLRARNESGNSKSKEKAKSKLLPTKVGTYKGEAPRMYAPRSQKCVQRRRAWACRTVGAMDGAIEPPWMGSRRVLPSRTLRLPTYQEGAALALALALSFESGPAGRRPASDTLTRRRCTAAAGPARAAAHRSPTSPVADRDHPQHLRAFHHRQVADAVVGHQLQAMLHLLARRDRHHLCGHDLGHRRIS